MAQTMTYKPECISYSAYTEGFRFHPTDRELMKYLLHYVIDNPLPTLVPIEEEDLYLKDPWVFFDARKEKTIYCFTELKKLKKGNLRFVRTVGDGSWKSQDRGKAIISERGSVLGYKRSLRYQLRGSEHDGQWLMKEYSLSAEVKNQLRKQLRENNKENYVLCRVKRKNGEYRKNEKDGPTVQNEAIETEELNAIISDPLNGVLKPVPTLNLAL
nr:NAC domain-containing protein 83-like [Solanum lycopersicum]